MISTTALPKRVDRLEEMMAQLSTHIARVSENINKYSEQRREENEKMDQRLALSSQKTDQRLAKLALSSQKVDQRFTELALSSQKVDQRLAELALSSQKTEEHLTKVSNDLRRDRRNLNKRISEMSHKMGTMAEDLVAPSIPGILAKMVNCKREPQMEGVRLKRRLPGGRSQEYDVVAVCGDYLLICEVKSNMRPEDIRPLRRKLEIVREFLPEFADKKVIGALATFYMDPNHVKHGERLGFIMLGVVDGLMQILNQDGFVPKAY